MIEITVYRNQNNLYTGFDCIGHAGYANAGEDVVCAGVSAPADGEDDTACAENRLVRRKRRVFESAERAAGRGKCEIIGKQVIA